MVKGATMTTMDDGRVAFLTNAAKNLSPQLVNTLTDLQELVVFRARLLDQVGELVGQLRAEGVSWGLIGWYVGTTAEAARQRWGGQGGNNA
jgi:hypothetical protein